MVLSLSNEVYSEEFKAVPLWDPKSAKLILSCRSTSLKFTPSTETWIFISSGKTKPPKLFAALI
ncbi:hypothetical protein [Mycoplasmopsis felis]|uniref:hypothetical protein n=1 Tax=Mycoplasmopsis felis TaxID=33923 RepID=UPI0021AFA84C|nr:hypothetical protein [Mycoplasmopsis felis]UWV84390.1 hypothetical protein NWE58_02975 [Mycoplasmopsis felis]